MDIKIVAVVGGGMMGRQIGLNTAKYGFEVHVTDSNPEVCVQAKEWAEEYLAGRIAKGRMTAEEVEAVRSRFHVEERLEEAVKNADLVIEAIFENEDAKKDVFRKIAAATKPDAIMATNSSTMVSSLFVNAVRNPAKLANLHYFNPAMVMELVEVVAGEHTSEETAQTLVEFCKATGKHPVLMKKELESFIVNRILSVIVNEAYWLVENGYCTVEDVDIACEKGLSHKMGPFRTKDLTSLDRHFLMLKAQYEKTGEKPVGYDLVGSLYEQGRYGRKSGHGFYDYE